MGKHALTNRKSSLQQDYKIRAEVNKKKNNFNFLWIVLLILVLFIWLMNKNTLELKNISPPDEFNKKNDLDHAGLTLTPKIFHPDYPDFHPPLVIPEKPLQTIEFVIKKGDTLEVLFAARKLNIGDLAEITAIETSKKHIKFLMPGDIVTIEHNKGRVISLKRHLDINKTLYIKKLNGKYKSSFIERNINIRKRFGYGKIKTSLFESAIDNGLTERLIMNLTEILAWDIDFVFDIRVNDDFYILFEEIWQDDKFVAEGKIIAVEFNNNGRTIQALRYTNKTGESNYYTPEGKSMRKAFVRAPLDFTRVSSNFNPNRKHPILNTIRAHRGVDYAASKGTKIKASGDGKVLFKGVKGGYGNVIILQHGENITTLYAHMSKFAAKIRTGQRIKQNQTIGFVGSSGLATAPHLHYEYRINGIHQNPRTVKLPKAAPIDDIYKQDFEKQSHSIMRDLLQFKETQNSSVVFNN